MLLEEFRDLEAQRLDEQSSITVGLKHDMHAKVYPHSRLAMYRRSS
jgi:hypothetical protein